MRELALVPHAPRPRRRERDELGDGPRAALLREPDQREQHLCGRLCVGQRAMARLHRGAEEIGELREAGAGDAAGQQATGERDRVDDRRGEARARQPFGLAIEEREIEARVVRDEHRVAREREEVAHRGRGRRRAAELPVGEPGERRDRRSERHARVDERLELVDELEALHQHGADLADLRQPGPEAGRLEIDDDVARLLEEQVGAERPREPDRVAVPREPRIGLDHLGEQ